jgi:hypothetical protein
MSALRRLPPTLTVYASGSVGPFVSDFLADRHIVFVDSESELPLLVDAMYVREGSALSPDAQTFRRSRSGHLATFVRAHFFEITIMRAGDAGVFRDGWYGEEGDGVTTWRWMPGRAVMMLPPVGTRARLTLEFSVPRELVPVAPTLTLKLNGRVVDRLRCTAEHAARSWDLDARPDAGNELVLTIEPVFNPARAHASDDSRDLGLQLLLYGWRAR